MRTHDYNPYYAPYWDGYHRTGMTLRAAIISASGDLWEGQHTLPATVLDGTVEKTARTNVGTCYLLVRGTDGEIYISYGPADCRVPPRSGEGRLCLGFLDD
jgi:hypothetical protein